jgi:hypothetical protein
MRWFSELRGRDVNAMSISSHFALLGLAAVLSHPLHQLQVDFKMTSPDGIQRITQLWLVTYINEGGQEVVAQARLETGEYAPMIAADSARLESMMAAARGLAKANKVKMLLIKFSNRLDIEDIAP